MIRLDLRDADAVTKIAGDLARAGRQTEAADLLARALDLSPDDADLAFRLGVTFAALGRPGDAKDAYRQALTADGNHFGALNNLAAAHTADGEPETAIPLFERAATLRPGDPQVAVNLANAHYEAGNLGEAETLFRGTAARWPDFSPAQSGLGTTLVATGRTEDAVAAFRRAVALDPGNADDRSRLGMALLALGEIAEGGAAFEWRWKAARFTTPPRDFPFPQWRGEPLDGKTILVWGEQGVGDEIVMLGLVAALRRHAARVLLECDPRLAPLVARSLPGIDARPRSGHGRPPSPDLLAEKIDYQSPAFGLVHRLANTPADLASPGPILHADPDKRDARRRRYDALGPGLKIGIAWHSANRRRSRDTAPLIDWAPVLCQPGIRFIDLQYGNRRDDRKAAAHAHGVEIYHDETVDSLASLDDFAAQIAALDLVITTANTAADMAGALGVETWTMLPAAPDWRWFLGGDRVPWYPSMRVFRQRSDEAESAVIARAGHALREKLES